MLFDPSRPMNPPAGWDAVRDFFEGAYGRGIRPRGTRHKIMQAINHLARHAAEPWGVNEQTIVSYVQATVLAGNAPETTNGVLVHMRTVTKYLKESGIIAVDPFALGVKYSRKKKPYRGRKNKHHTLAEIQRVLAQADREWEDARGLQERFRAGRLRALVWLMSHAALRVGEGLCLRRCRYDGQIVEVRAEDAPEEWLKTECSERDVAVPRAAAVRLDEWTVLLDGYERLFPCTYADSPWLHGSDHYRPSARVKQLGERAGVRGVTLLSLRHTWQTHAPTAWGMTAKQIAMVVGHSSLETQRHYQHDDRRDLIELMRRVNFGAA